MSIPLVPGPPGAPGPPSQLSLAGMPGALGAGGAPPGPGAGMAPFGLTDVAYRQGSQPGMFWANETIPHHYVTVPDMNKNNAGKAATYSRGLGIGMMLFARNSDFHPGAGKERFVGTSQSQASSTASQFLEWSQLIDWLANCCEPDRYASAEDLLAEWSMTGVLKVEVAPNAEHGTYGERAATRLVNLIVGGRVKTFNLWGERALESLPLYFLVVKGPPSTAGGQDAPVASRKRIEAGQDEPKPPDVAEVEKYVWKLVPYASRTSPRPSSDVLMFFDLQMNARGEKEVVERLGARVYVGTVTQVEGAAREVEAAARHSVGVIAAQMRMQALEQIEIACGV